VEENVFCQELPDGGGGFLSCDAAARREWNRIRVYQPSLNVVAKLALGIADEPLLKVVQQKLMEGAENLELLRLSSLSKIKADSYKKTLPRLYRQDQELRDQGQRRRRTGGGRGFPTAVKTRKASGSMADTVTWQYKALTERDLLDIEKGSVVTVGRKCIVTSLAADAAKRKSIRICREGEVK
jgi:hypothetical protein